MCLHRKFSGFSPFIVHFSRTVVTWHIIMLKEKVVVVVGGVDAGFKTKDEEKSIYFNKGNGKPSVSCFPKCIFSSPFDCYSVQDVYSL